MNCNWGLEHKGKSNRNEKISHIFFMNSEFLFPLQRDKGQAFIVHFFCSCPALTRLMYAIASYLSSNIISKIVNT